MRPSSLPVKTSSVAAVVVRPVVGEMTCTRPSPATSSSIGLLVLLSSVTFSKLSVRDAPQSASCTPAAVWMPPSRWARNCGSAYDSAVWPPPVYQARPPS